MPDVLRLFSSELLPNFRLADVIDIALVAAFMYVLITWVRESTSRSASRRTLAVVGTVAVVYAIAQMLELYLVEQLIEVLALVFAVAAGIAFQSDIRRLIDRFGAGGRNALSDRSSSASAVNTLVEACARMADQRTGALIALRGREPWDRYVEGGIRLDGVVSLPLLVSTFNPQAPGHDGAVLMQGNRVLKFGAHLPLSSRLPESSRYGGTRHAAAQGLSEHCDAFVIVVSEERGVVSFAHDGKLRPLSSAADLKGHLEAFWVEHYGDAQATTKAWYARRHIQTALLASATAVILWFAVAYRPEVRTRTFTVPVELRDLGPYVRLRDAGESEVRVTLTGPEQAFRLLDPTRLVATFDASGVNEGLEVFRVTEDVLNLPPDINLSSAQPDTFHVRSRRIDYLVPVVVDEMGELPDGVRLVGITTDPDSVRVVLTDTTAEAPDAIRLTTPVDLSTIRRTTTVQGALQPAPGTELPEGQSRTVNLRVEVEGPGTEGGRGS